MTADLAIGDALERMADLEASTIDAVVTDPPYSSGTRREASKTVRGAMVRRDGADDEWFATDNLTTHGFVWLMRACAVQWARVLKPGGHVLCFIDWRMWAPLSGAIESADLRPLGLVVWNKGKFGLGTHFRKQHELIVHFSKGTPARANRRDTPDVLTHKPIRGGDHPTEKPVALLRDLIEVVTDPGDLVLDPFAGSASTGDAALQSGRRFVGVERHPPYVERATRRLKAVNEQPRLDV